MQTTGVGKISWRPMTGGQTDGEKGKKKLNKINLTGAAAAAADPVRCFCPSLPAGLHRRAARTN